MIIEGEAMPCLVGVLTPDPLRLEGLAEILKPSGLYRVLALDEAERSMTAADTAVAVIDVTAVTHLESLVREFRRRHPLVRILVMGPEVDLEGIGSVISYGARGYVQYTANGSEWMQALEVVRSGSIWAPRLVLTRLLERTERATQIKLQPTPREEEVLRLLVQGYPNRQIAEALGVDEATVKAHLGRLMRKLGVRNRTALSMRALGQGSVGNND